MNTNNINSIMEQALSLKSIAQAYTEVSSAKLKKIRNQVEKNRFYLSHLSEVYKSVKTVAAKQNILPPAKFQKTINVLITSNYHFYGSINTNLIKYFLASIKPESDQLIIGKTALEWLRTNRYGEPFQSFELSSDYPTQQELSDLVTKIKDYTQIVVYYSELETVMVQTPTSKDITQSSVTSPNPVILEPRQELFIFEPEVEKILDFFNSQVTNLLLQQTFLESELARTASRLISMDQAQTKADKYILEQERLIARAKKSIVNSRLLQTYAAVVAIRESARNIQNG